MQELGAHSMSFGLAVALCAGAWLSGTLFGWGLRETREWIRGAERPVSPRPETRPPAGAKRRRSRSGSYYFSEETRGWGSGRWRRRFGWASAAFLVMLIGGSLLMAVASYKPARHHPVGAHPR